MLKTYDVKHEHVVPVGKTLYFSQPLILKSIVLKHNDEVLTLDPIIDAISSLVTSDKLEVETTVVLGTYLDKEYDALSYEGVSYTPVVSDASHPAMTRSIIGTSNLIKTISEINKHSDLLVAVSENHHTCLKQNVDGHSCKNRVEETHRFSSSGKIGVIRPVQGIFFEHDFKLFQNDTLLEEGKDYELIPIPATQIARMCGMSHTLYDQIKINNPTTDPYTLHIQAYGGLDCQSRMDSIEYTLGVIAKQLMKSDPALAHRLDYITSSK